MTRMELESMLFLRKEIEAAAAEQLELRMTMDSIKPMNLEGLPHSKKLKSQVEELAMKLLKQEERWSRLQTLLPLVKTALLEKILQEEADQPAQAIIILRYVHGYTHKEIAHRTGYTLRQVFRLQKNFLKRVT